MEEVVEEEDSEVGEEGLEEVNEVEEARLEGVAVRGGRIMEGVSTAGREGTCPEIAPKRGVDHLVLVGEEGEIGEDRSLWQFSFLWPSYTENLYYIIQKRNGSIRRNIYIAEINGETTSPENLKCI